MFPSVIEWWHAHFKLLGPRTLWRHHCLLEMPGLQSIGLDGLLLGVHTEAEVVEAEAVTGATVGLVVDSVVSHGAESIE